MYPVSGATIRISQAISAGSALIRFMSAMPRELAANVRSSATAEDLPEASFAGQQETFLNVRGEAALLDSVRSCFASLYTDRAISYRENHGIDQVRVALSAGDPDCPDGGTMFVSVSGNTFACNGAAGPQGDPGDPGQSVTSVALSTGDPDCPDGGSMFVSASGNTFACNGAAARSDCGQRLDNGERDRGEERHLPPQIAVFGLEQLRNTAHDSACSVR